jgi:asparagine synthetase B (glutamine-hydrolysing)
MLKIIQFSIGTIAWGVELRVPFLDTNFVNYAMSVRAEDRMITPENKSIEKFILREAFAGNYLPDEVLWRQKVSDKEIRKGMRGVEMRRSY